VHPLALSCGIVTAIWLLAASRWIVTDTVVPWDSKNQFYAFFRFLAATLDAGDLPFWNPYHYGGHPSVADPQSLIFAPLFSIWALFDPAPSIRAFDLVVYVHLWIGALALGAIGWRARWPVAACVLAATIFMLGGAASGRLQHTGLIISYGLFPPALLCLQLALQRRSIAFAVLAGVVTAAMALGRNQVAMLLGFVLVAAVVVEVLSAERPWHYVRGRLGVLGVASAISLALIAIPMLLTLQFAVLSNRPEIGLETALKGSLHPANLATLGIANIFGSHQVLYWGPNYRLPEIEFTDQSFNYLFVGAVPVVLMLWIGIAGGAMWRRGRLLATVILIVSLLYMLGRYTPFFSTVFSWWPGVSKFRRPVDGAFPLLVAMAFLAGHLLTDYMRAGVPRVALHRAIIVLVTVFMVIGGAVLFSHRYGGATYALVAVLKSVPVFAAVIALLVLPKTIQMRAISGALLTSIAVAELVYWNAASHLNAEDHAIYSVFDRPNTEEATAIDILDRAIRAQHERGEYPRVEIMGVGGPWQNLAVVRRWEATNGYNPLRIGFYDRLVSPGEATYSPALRDFPGSFEGYDCALARALGLEYVVLDRPIGEVPHLARRPVADILLDGPFFWIYRLRHPMPRVNFATRIQIADADATPGGRLVLEPSPDRVLVDDDTPPKYIYASEELAVARIVAWHPGRIDIDVESGHGGVLSHHGTYYPGWIAEIDGRQAPLLRTDVLFRGVEVPPGHHRVVFRFSPFTWENLSNALSLALRGRPAGASR
jgi:hypothetical protein